MDTRRIKTATILLFSAALIGIVLAASIGPNGLSGFTWYNGTNVSVDTYYDGIYNVTQALWDNLGATVYLGFDANRAYQENYFLVDGTNDRASVQASLNYINAKGGGTLVSELGVVQIESDVYVPSSELYYIEGMGLPNVLYNITGTGGSVWSFINGARFTTNATASDLVLRDIAFGFQGVYTDSAFDFMGAGGTGVWVSSYGCGYAFSGTVPDGNAGNPASTLSGNCLNVGGVSGPSNLQYTWVDNRFYDNRQGSATASCLLCFCVEELTFERNFFNVAFQNTLNAPNLMQVTPVSGASISYNTIYTGPVWDAAGSQYAHQIMTSGGDKNFQINFNQFFEPSDISGSHLYTNSGVMNVEGMYPIYAEGGTDPVDLSVGGSGTVYINFKGRGYEVGGSATILNGNTNVNVTHGLVGTPTFGTLTGTTTDTDLLYFGNLNSTVAQIMASDGAVGGDRTVYYHLIYTKSG